MLAKKTLKFGFLLFLCIIFPLISFNPAKAANTPESTKNEIKLHLFPDTDYSPDIDIFMQMGYASGSQISPDGKTIYFKNSFTSLPQIFRVDKESSYPYQLTFSSDSVNQTTLSPDGKYMIYCSDHDGDEQYQLYLMDTKTGRSMALTKENEVRFGKALWSPDQRKIYFQGNREKRENFSVYEMDLASGKIKLLAGDPGYLNPTAISPDGEKLYYSEHLSNVNKNIWEFDIKTGKKRLLTPHEGNTVNETVALSADGGTLYYLSNGNKKGALKLSSMNLSTGKSKIIYDADSPWDVDVAEANPQGDKIAIVINNEGYGELTILDLKTMKTINIPELKGIIGSVSLSGGSKIAFTLFRPTKVPDIYTWDWNTKKLTQITRSSYAGIDPSRFIEPKLIRYKSFDGLEIPAFLYLPPNYKENMGKIPFVIDFHGGPEGQSRPYFQKHFNYMLLRGYGIITPNVRGSSGYGKAYLDLDNYKKRMDSVKDGYYAAKYLIDQGYTQKGKIGIKGGSYGGYMVMALITEYPDMWGAAYESVGIVDLVNFLKNTKPYRRKLRESEYGPLSDPEFLKSISPIHKLDRIKTPLMISHGKNDPRVPVSEAYLIIDTLKERGVPVKTMIFEDEGHGVSELKNRIMLYREIMKFFDEHLK